MLCCWGDDGGKDSSCAGFGSAALYLPACAFLGHPVKPVPSSAHPGPRNVVQQDSYLTYSLTRSLPLVRKPPSLHPSTGGRPDRSSSPPVPTYFIDLLSPLRLLLLAVLVLIGFALEESTSYLLVVIR